MASGGPFWQHDEVSPPSPLDAAEAVRDHDGGVRLAVRAQPRASKNALVGLLDDGRGGVSLKISVTAPPVEGEANAAIVQLLAQLLGVPRRDVRIVSGEGGRTKIVDVRGLDREAALAQIRPRVG